MSQFFLQFDEPETVAPVTPAVVSRPTPSLIPGGRWGRLTPRDYQQEAHDRTLELLQENPGVLVRLGTGLGKTPTACMIIQSWLAQSPLHRVLVSIHEVKLVRQFAQELWDFLGIRCGIEMAEEHVAPNHLPYVTVSSRQSLVSKKTVIGPGGQPYETRRLEKFHPERFCWLLLTDESHRWAYKLSSVRPIIDHFEKRPFNGELLREQGIDPGGVIAQHRRLGTTATPERTDGVSPARLFPACAIDVNYAQAVEMGFVVPYRQKYITVEGVDFAKIKTKASGDFDDGALERLLLERENLLASVLPTVQAAGHRRTIIFCAGKQAAAETAAMIRTEWPEQGAESIDGDSPHEIREDVFRRHQAGDFQFLCVCGLCREGYNDPGLECVAILRPTKSRPLAEQMKGRGCRPLKGIGLETLKTPEQRRAAIAASAKPYCLIIDLVGATGLGDTASTAHILANGRPDEVVEQAIKRMAEKAKEGEEFDPAEELARAEEDLERERLAREERRRRLEEEARKRATLQGTVRYTEHDVRSGDVAQKRNRKPEARMPFGKHKGQPLSEIPAGYLEYMIQQPFRGKSQWVKRAMENELASRLERSIPPTRVNAPQPRPKIDDINRLLLETW